MRFLFTTLLFSILHLIANSQTPVSPDLAIGAGKVLFDKGTLDSELISEIVVTKRDEVKTQLIQNIMNRQLRNSNAAIRQYVSSNLELLFGKASIETKKKELLKNTAELALVIGVSEYFLRDIKNRSENYFAKSGAFTQEIPENGEFSRVEFEFMMEYIRNLDLNSRSAFVNEFFGAFHTEQKYAEFIDAINDHKECIDLELEWLCGNSISETCENKFDKEARDKRDLAFYNTLPPINRIYLSLSYYNVLGFSKYDPKSLRRLAIFSGFGWRDMVSKVLDELHSSTTQPDGDFLLKPVLLSSMKNEEVFAGESRKGFTSPNHLYIDLIYKVLRENEYVRQFGFFQRTGGRVTSLSSYQSIIENDNSPITQFLQPLEQRIEETINKLFRNYEFVGRLKQLYTLSKSTLEEFHRIGQLANDWEIESGDNMIKYLLENINQELRDLNIDNPWDKDLAKKHEKLVSDLTITFNQIDTDSKSISDFLNYIENEVTPQLLTYKMRDKNFGKLLESIDDASKILKSVGIFRAVKDLTGDQDFSIEKIENAIDKYEPYLSLLDNLSNLDKSITYDRIFKFVSDLGSICSSQKASNVLNTMVNFMDKYAIIDNESNKVQIDLEGVTGDFYKRYQENAKSRVTFSFTVGVNTASSWFRSKNIRFATDSEGETLSNATFISEKIGIKWNAIDFNKAYIKGKSNIKPLVNNIHVLTYASGLLYQIDALNSVDGFNSSSFGVGVGTTFFNNLDFNVSYAGQVGSFKHNNYLNIGFDIQFTEYLSALSKKRKQNQMDQASGI